MRSGKKNSHENIKKYRKAKNTDRKRLKMLLGSS